MTEKEKQTLRLLLAGHDAKSMARHLGLSVHTINERLRDSRRKLSVSSSKEAARLLRQSEASAPQSFGDAMLGDARPTPIPQLFEPPGGAPPKQRRTARVFGGLAMISIVAAAFALLTPVHAPQADLETRTAAESEVTRSARNWLALIDDARWSDSWAQTAQSFRALNTVDAWRSASEKARVPLGRVLSRTLLSEQDVPAPPNGYRMVRFRTDFANKSGMIETVSLDREGGNWKIVGIYID